MYVCMYVCMYTYVCMFVCMYVCMYVYIYMLLTIGILVYDIKVNAKIFGGHQLSACKFSNQG